MCVCVCVCACVCVHKRILVHAPQAAASRTPPRGNDLTGFNLHDTHCGGL